MSKSVSWDDQRVFLAVLDEGSLAGAARRLGLSHPTVRARIEALEQALGTVLFTRSVNGLTATEAAETLRHAAQTMATASELFVRQASAPVGKAAGTVRISVSEFMGVEVLPPMLLSVRTHFPDIKLELSLTNLAEDVLAQEVDIAVRTVAPKQAALVARKVAGIPIGLFASRDYVARRGAPASLADLVHHDTIGPDRSPLDLAATVQLGLQPNQFAVRTDSHPAQLAAARAGLGIAPVQVTIGLQDPGLVRVLPDFSIMTLEVWIVAHENLIKAPRVRAVFDELVRSFISWSAVAASSHPIQS